MMASRRVVLVLEAEKLLIPKRESKAADEEQERLERFIQIRRLMRPSCSCAVRLTSAGEPSSC